MMNGWFTRLGLAAFLICASSALAASADDITKAGSEEGFKQIFDGKSLDGWDGNPKFWSVKDGCINGETTVENPTSGNTFLIWRQGDVDDFELRCSFKLMAHNSGIQYRSREIEKWVISGYQADFEGGDTYSGILYEERARGILAERGQKVNIKKDGNKVVTGSFGDSKALQSAIKKQQWNDYRIVAKGNHLYHEINGQGMIEVVDEQSDKSARTGLLALQLHAGMPMQVQFKNIRLKRLPMGDLKKLVLVAGTPSHGKGEHEFNAGVHLLKHCLDKTPGVLAAAYYNGWPKDPTALDNADGILLYMDGGSNHPAIQGDHLKELGGLMKRGVGLACAHYAVEVPKDKGGPEFLQWIGGYYETGYSINPTWEADFKELPKHPVTNGVKPFKITDEWYYNMRWRSDSSMPHAMLVATPPDSTRGTPAAKEHPGRTEVMSWVWQRPDGGRGFGFTGGHYHKNWGDDNFRKLVLNALLWTAKAEVPTDGVKSEVTAEELKENLDPK